jgi:hypothetical protein
LNESGQMQCRLAIETRTNPSRARSRELSDDHLSIYFTVRQYWGLDPNTSFVEAMRRQREAGEEILERAVVPRVVKPLAQLIASR